MSTQRAGGGPVTCSPRSTATRPSAPEAQQAPSEVHSTLSRLALVDALPGDPAVVRHVGAGGADRDHAGRRRAGRRGARQERGAGPVAAELAALGPGRAGVVGVRRGVQPTVRVLEVAAHRDQVDRSRTAREKIPPASLRTIGVSTTDQVRPRSVVWKTRAAVPPPAIQASCSPAVTRQVPLAAKPNSPSSAGGIPADGPLGPRAAAVLGHQDPELAVHRVAHRQPVAAVPEAEAVVERVRRVVAEPLLPGPAAVVGAVDPGVAAGADRQDHRVRGVPRLDVAELEVAGVTARRDVLPVPAAVGGAEHGALGAAHPGDVAVDRGQAAELGLRPGRRRPSSGVPRRRWRAPGPGRPGQRPGRGRAGRWRGGRGRGRARWFPRTCEATYATGIGAETRRLTGSAAPGRPRPLRLVGRGHRVAAHRVGSADP